MSNNIEYFLEQIADNLEKIVEQLEIVNSPEKDREFNRWFYDWNKRIKNKQEIIKLYTDANKPEKVKLYIEELEQLKAENYNDIQSL